MIIGTGVLVRKPDGRVLLGLRTYPGEEACWCLPGGKPDPGESFEEAARRETEEECGIRLTGPLRVTALFLGAPSGIVTAWTTVEATVDEAAVATCREPEKFECWDWFDPGALPGPLFAPTAAVIDHWLGRPVSGAVVYLISVGR
jgi:8-oxo-dGTP diphosphatase